MSTPAPSERTFEMGRIWDALWARRWRIARLTGGVTLVALVIALLLPPWYRAQASLLPPTEEQSGFGLTNLIRGLAVPGVKLPTEATASDVFLAILRSRRLGAEMVARFDLQRVYRRKLVGDAIKELQRHSTFRVTEAGTIEISVEDRDRKRAADMTNAYVDFLDRFNREIRMTKGRRSRLFLEQRLAETGKALSIAEQKLTDYQAHHKTVAISPEVSSAIENAARLAAERMALQVRLGVIRSYTRGQSEEEQQVQGQLAQLDRQLQALPTTGIELARLIRDAKTQETLSELLTAQFEEARLTEVRDVITVEVLDPAVPPERKSRPRRSILVGGAFALALAVGMAWAALEQDVPRAGSAPGRSA